MTRHTWLITGSSRAAEVVRWADVSRAANFPPGEEASEADG